MVRISDTKWKEEWKVDVTCPIYKKDDKLLCENYKAATFLNVACEVLFGIR